MMRSRERESSQQLRRTPARPVSRVTRLVATLLTVFMLAACSSSPAASGSLAEDMAQHARPVTTDESQQLALMRVNNLTAGARAVTFEANENGVNFAFNGWFDFRTDTGYGTLSDDAGDTLLVLWNDDFFAVHLDDTAELQPGSAPAIPPDLNALDTRWSGTALDPAGSVLHTILAAIVNLGSDRPENPLLLQQAGALWVGTATTIGPDARLGDSEAAFTVFAGPASDEPTTLTEVADLLGASSTRFWLDDSGVLVRVDLLTAVNATPITVRFADAPEIELPQL